MELEFNAIDEITDNYEQQIKYYGLNSKSNSLVHSEKLADLYKSVPLT